MQTESARRGVLGSTALRIAVGITLPTISCVGYYSLNNYMEEAGVAATAVILAYPMALIGLMGLAALALSGSRSRRLYWAAALCVALPTAFIAFIRA